MLRLTPVTLALALLLSLTLACRPGSAPDLPQVAEDHVTPTSSAGTESAVFAGGCFWCTEAVFEALHGVRAVVSGYAGGTAADARYEVVSAGRTNHAESIRVEYDPAEIRYGDLLEVFFSVAHDPTQLNYQGPDHGRQYRSAIFYASEAERVTAAGYIEQLESSRAFGAPVVTALEPLDHFYPAEESHQDFVRRNPSHPYVVRWALPKLTKLRQHHPQWVAEHP